MWGVCVCRSEEHTSELQSHLNLVCRLLLEKKKTEHSPTKHTSRAHVAQPDTSHTHALAALSARHSLSPPASAHAPPHTHTHIFFFNDPATTEIYPLSLHDALPI